VAAGRPLRLRLLNAANVRSMGVLFKGAEPRIVAYDGQPLAVAQPLGAQALVLAPGQRADLLLPPVSVKTVTIALDLMEDVVELAYLEPQGEPQSTPPGEQVLAANPISTGFDAAAARAVTVTLEGGAKGGLKSAWVGDQEMDTRALLERGLAWAMNGVSGTGGPPLFTAKKGEALLVTIDNRTTFAQPLHIHGHVWRVLDMGGEAVADAPWRDTVVVAPRTAVKLSLIADNPGVWVIQSLVAERVDSGMLASFLVE
jgi:FtsP/CotA-like multicopper oxidase with cupredoxin domain